MVAGDDPFAATAFSPFLLRGAAVGRMREISAECVMFPLERGIGLRMRRRSACRGPRWCVKLTRERLDGSGNDQG